MKYENKNSTLTHYIQDIARQHLVVHTFNVVIQIYENIKTMGFGGKSDEWSANRFRMISLLRSSSF